MTRVYSYTKYALLRVSLTCCGAKFSNVKEAMIRLGTYTCLYFSESHFVVLVRSAFGLTRKTKKAYLQLICTILTTDIHYATQISHGEPLNLSNGSMHVP